MKLEHLEAYDALHLATIVVAAWSDEGLSFEDGLIIGDALKVGRRLGVRIADCSLVAIADGYCEPLLELDGLDARTAFGRLAAVVGRSPAPVDEALKWFHPLPPAFRQPSADALAWWAERLETAWRLMDAVEARADHLSTTFASDLSMSATLQAGGGTIHTSQVLAVQYTPTNDKWEDGAWWLNHEGPTGMPEPLDAPAVVLPGGHWADEPVRNSPAGPEGRGLMAVLPHEAIGMNYEADVKAFLSVAIDAYLAVLPDPGPDRRME